MDQLRMPLESMSFHIHRAVADIIKDSNKDENFAVGSFSIAAAASLIYVGSSGKTRERLERLLHYEKLFDGHITPELILIAFRQAIAHLTKRPDKHFPLHQDILSSAFQLVLANKAFFKEGDKVREEFRHNVSEGFGVKFEKTTLHLEESELETLRDQLNNWVATNTNGEITEALPKLSDEEAKLILNRMFLINVSFMRGLWMVPFFKSDTRLSIFTNSNGVKMITPMMRVVGQFPYSEDETRRVKYLEIPYANNEAALCIMLPMEPTRGSLFHQKKSLSIHELEHFSLFEYLDITRQKRLRKVELQIPIFKMDNTFDLKSIFRRIGLSIFLEEGGDFSNMVESPSKDFHVTGAFHKCSFEINELGSTADYFLQNEDDKEFLIENASLVGALRRTSMTLSKETVWDIDRNAFYRDRTSKIKQFHAVRPFLFSVRHNLSGITLFIGRVTDFPSAPVEGSPEYEKFTRTRKNSDDIRNRTWSGPEKGKENEVIEESEEKHGENETRARTRSSDFAKLLMRKRASRTSGTPSKRNSLY